MKIVGLSGYAGSGKDTFADVLENYGYRRYSWADPMRKAMLTLDPVIPAYDEYLRLSEVIDTHGWTRAKQLFPEVRRLLQVYGTEVGRAQYGTNFWVDLTFRNIAADNHDAVVLTDCRFPNEARRVQDAAGLVVRVTRPGVEAVNAHPSESSLDDWDFGAHVLNDGTIADLEQFAQFVDQGAADLMAFVASAGLSG